MVGGNDPENDGGKIMLRIAICDDEEVFGQHLKQIVSGFFEERQVPCEISLFGSGEEFVKLNMEMAK